MRSEALTIGRSREEAVKVGGLGRSGQYAVRRRCFESDHNS